MASSTSKLWLLNIRSFDIVVVLAWLQNIIKNGTRIHLFSPSVVPRICDQPRYPSFTRNHAYLFLHACLWDVPDTKKTIHKYLKIRGNAPDIFDNRDPLDQGIKTIYNIT